MLSQNLTISKNGPTFLPAVVWLEFFIYLKRKSSFHTSIATNNRENQIDNATDNSHSSYSDHNHIPVTLHGNE